MKLHFLCSVLFASLCGSAQSLTAGQKLPVFTFQNVLNHRSSSLALTDYKGKKIIFDFWNTRCLSCIRSFPEIDSLQKAFAGTLLIVLVTKDSPETVTRFFSDHKKIRMPGVPLVTADSVLSGWFPSSVFPYSVWLDEKLAIQHLTSNYNMTREHVAAFIQKKSLALASTSGKIVRTSLVPERDSLAQNLLYFSCLTKCTPGINIGHTEGTKYNEKLVRISANCSSVAWLYKKAFSEHDKYSFLEQGTFLLNVRDSLQYLEPADMSRFDDWLSRYAYNYELVAPKERKTDLYRIMQKDLARYFPLEAGIERRKIKCMVLVRLPGEDNIKTKGGRAMEKFSPEQLTHQGDDTMCVLQNQPFAYFADRLGAVISASTKLPFVDETKYKENIDVAIPVRIVEEMQLPALRKALHLYNLDVVEKYAERDVLVLEERRGE